MLNVRENGERRQAGALLQIKRTNNGKESVLLIQDKVAIETSTGIAGWTRATEKQGFRWGLPGGGRGVTDNGSEETGLETIANEAIEELELGLIDTLGEITIFHQNQMPFAVAQHSLKKASIDAFAVSLWNVEYDALPKEIRDALDLLILNEAKAFWFKLDELYTVISQLLSNPAHVRSALNYWRVRPQVLSSVLLGTTTFESNEDREKWQQANAATFKRAKRRSRREELPLNNGFFDQKTGTILKPDDLNAEDRAYLYASLN